MNKLKMYKNHNLSLVDMNKISQAACIVEDTGHVWKIGKNQKSIIFNRAWTIVAQNPSKRITEGIILVGRKWEKITFITFYRRNEERK